MYSKENLYRKKNTGTLYIALPFLLLLYSNFILTIFKVEFFQGFHENRQLFRLSDISTNSSLKKVCSDFEQYLNDRFAFRKPLVFMLNSLKYYVFNSSSGQVAMPAKNGWIFYGTRDLMRDYKRIDTISEQQLQVIEKSVLKKYIWLTQRNIEFKFIIVPNKHNIYPQYMPGFLRQGPGLSKGESLVKHLSTALPDITIDIFDVLRASSANHQVYYRIDTHWNHQGAKVATENVLNELMQNSNIQFRALPKMHLETKLFSPGNFGRVMGVPLHEYELIPKPIGGWTWKSVSVDDLKQLLPDRAKINKKINLFAPKTKVIILGDSYMDRFSKYFSEAFREVISVNLWNTDPTPNNRFPIRLIENIHPDLVIILFAERRIGFHHKQNPKYYYYVKN